MGEWGWWESDLILLVQHFLFCVVGVVQQ